MDPSLTKIVQKAFESDEEVTLTMLYEKARKLGSTKEKAIMKHTIRSIVHKMKKQNKIESIAQSTYKKV